MLPLLLRITSQYDVRKQAHVLGDFLGKPTRKSTDDDRREPTNACLFHRRCPSNVKIDLPGFLNSQEGGDAAGAVADL